MDKPRHDGWEGEACVCGSPHPFIPTACVAGDGVVEALKKNRDWYRCPMRDGWHTPGSLTPPY